MKVQVLAYAQLIGALLFICGSALFLSISDRSDYRPIRHLMSSSLCLLAFVSALDAGKNLGLPIRLDYARTFLIGFTPLSWAFVNYVIIRMKDQNVLETRTRELATINSIGWAVGKSLDLEMTTRIALSHIIVRTGMTGGVVYLLDEQTGGLAVAGVCRLPKELSRPGHPRKSWEEIHRRAIDKDVLIAHGIGDIPETGGLHSLVKDVGCQTIFVMPLKHRGKAIGSMGLLGTGPTVDRLVGRDFLAAVGSQIAAAIENSRLYEKERRARKSLEALEVVSEAGLSTLSLDEMLQEMIRRIVREMNLNSGSIFILNEWTKELNARASYNLGKSSGVSLQLGEGLCGMVAREGRSVFILDAENDPRITSPRVKAKRVKSMLGVPLRVGERVIGALHVDSLEIRRFSAYEIHLLQTMADRASFAIENAGLYEKLKNSYLQTVMSLTEAVEAKDTHTRGHSEEVAIVARAIARKSGLLDETCEEIYHAGLLHDVGKIGTPESILTKPGPLSKDEYEQVKLHPVKGYEIVKPVAGLNGIRKYILTHHEHFDGKGYPLGMSGEDIPLGARVIAVADAFQAMVSNRPYRKARSIEEALEEIKKGRGTQFDATVADSFLSLAAEHEIGQGDLAKLLEGEEPRAALLRETLRADG